jgi:hypothetical protein
MLTRTLLALIIGAALSSNAIAANAADDESIYFDGGQYTAVFEQNAHHWRLLPMEGEDVDVTERASVCASGTHIPHGVWVVSRDASGRPQLIAPSTTILPPGFPEQLQLRACGDNTANASALLVPDVVLDWIESNVNSVMIDD